MSTAMPRSAPSDELPTTMVLIEGASRESAERASKALSKRVDLVALRVDANEGLLLTRSSPEVDGQGIADALLAAGLRPRAERPDRLTFGELELDRAARVARRDGQELGLTAREFDLLWHMALHPRQVLSTGQLLEAVWGFEPALDTGRIKVHVRRIRQKLEHDPSNPSYLRTVRGVGYRFDCA